MAVPLNSKNTELECYLPAGCLSSVAERLCVKLAVLGSIPGSDQIFLILYCLEKPVKDIEYI